MDNKFAAAKHSYGTARRKYDSLVANLTTAGQKEEAARAAYETAKERLIEARKDAWAAVPCSGLSFSQRSTGENEEEAGSVRGESTGGGAAGCSDGGDGGGYDGGGVAAAAVAVAVEEGERRAEARRTAEVRGVGVREEEETTAQGRSLSTTAAGTKRGISAMDQAGVVAEVRVT